MLALALGLGLGFTLATWPRQMSSRQLDTSCLDSFIDTFMDQPRRLGMGGYLLACLRTAGGKRLHVCAVLIGARTQFFVLLDVALDFAPATVDKLDLDAVRARSTEVYVVA